MRTHYKEDKETDGYCQPVPSGMAIDATGQVRQPDPSAAVYTCRRLIDLSLSLSLCLSLSLSLSLIADTVAAGILYRAGSR